MRRSPTANKVAAVIQRKPGRSSIVVRGLREAYLGVYSSCLVVKRLLRYELTDKEKL